MRHISICIILKFGLSRLCLGWDLGRRGGGEVGEIRSQRQTEIWRRGEEESMSVALWPSLLC